MSKIQNTKLIKSQKSRRTPRKKGNNQFVADEPVDYAAVLRRSTIGSLYATANRLGIDTSEVNHVPKKSIEHVPEKIATDTKPEIIVELPKVDNKSSYVNLDFIRTLVQADRARRIDPPFVKFHPTETNFQVLGQLLKEKTGDLLINRDMIQYFYNLIKDYTFVNLYELLKPGDAIVARETDKSKSVDPLNEQLEFRTKEYDEPYVFACSNFQAGVLDCVDQNIYLGIAKNFITRDEVSALSYNSTVNTEDYIIEANKMKDCRKQGNMNGISSLKYQSFFCFNEDGKFGFTKPEDPESMFVPKALLNNVKTYDVAISDGTNWGIISPQGVVMINFIRFMYDSYCNENVAYKFDDGHKSSSPLYFCYRHLNESVSLSEPHEFIALLLSDNGPLKLSGSSLRTMLLIIFNHFPDQQENFYASYKDLLAQKNGNHRQAVIQFIDNLDCDVQTKEKLKSEITEELTKRPHSHRSSQYELARPDFFIHIILEMCGIEPSIFESTIKPAITKDAYNAAIKSEPIPEMDSSRYLKKLIY